MASTIPARFDEIRRRAAATAGIGAVPRFSFSHIHHASAFGGSLAAERGHEWDAERRRCRERRPTAPGRGAAEPKLLPSVSPHGNRSGPRSADE